MALPKSVDSGSLLVDIAQRHNEFLSFEQAHSAYSPEVKVAPPERPSRVNW